MSQTKPEAYVRQAVDRCANCDWCRDYPKESSCLFFRRLYRLHDLERHGRGAITDAELKRLTDLCNLCGICPCVEIRTWVRQAKDGFVERDGLPKVIRILDDVRLQSKLAGMAPRLTNALLKDGPVSRGLKRLAGIHSERKLPQFPRLSFDVWAKKRGLHEKPVGDGPKVAYFTGCTARYLFPQVAQASVEVLEANGIAVYVPPQKCCGMPTMLEGDRRFTHATAEFNLRELSAVVEAGYDIVCSCPTCGYFMKSVLPADAMHTPGFRERIQRLAAEEGGDLVKTGQRLKREEPALQGRADPMFERASQPSNLRMILSGLPGTRPWLLRRLRRHRAPAYRQPQLRSRRIPAAARCGRSARPQLRAARRALGLFCALPPARTGHRPALAGASAAGPRFVGRPCRRTARLLRPGRHHGFQEEISSDLGRHRPPADAQDRSGSAGNAAHRLP
jgi:hypothetical protein